MRTHVHIPHYNPHRTTPPPHLGTDIQTTALVGPGKTSLVSNPPMKGRKVVPAKVSYPEPGVARKDRLVGKTRGDFGSSHSQLGSFDAEVETSEMIRKCGNVGQRRPASASAASVVGFSVRTTRAKAKLSTRPLSAAPANSPASTPLGEYS